MTHVAGTPSREALPLALAARIVREAEAMRDKSYRQHPLGQEWGRFLRAKRLAGCQPNTLLSYETVGRLFTLRYADFDSLEPFAGKEGPELVLDFLERNWGDADPQTLDQRTNVMRSFFEWAYRVDRISADPMRKIEKRRRKQRGPRRERIPAGPLARLVSAQDTTREQAALLLLGRLALRREDLRLLRVGEIDPGRDEIHLRHARETADSSSMPRPSARSRYHVRELTTGFGAAWSGPVSPATPCTSCVTRPQTTSGELGARRSRPRRSCGTSQSPRRRPICMPGWTTCAGRSSNCLVPLHEGRRIDVPT